MASSFGMIGILLCHKTEWKVFEEKPFNRLKGFLNSLDVGVLCTNHESTSVGNLAFANTAASSTPVAKVKRSRPRQMVFVLVLALFVSTSRSFGFASWTFATGPFNGAAVNSDFAFTPLSYCFFLSSFVFSRRILFFDPKAIYRHSFSR